jgi:hypothetical protein
MSKTTSELKMNDGKYDGKVVVTEMSVKGGDLPNGFGVKIDVEFDFTGVDPLAVAEVACGGQSLRVILQGELRKMSTSQLNTMAESGYTCQVSELVNRERAARDPQQTVTSAYGKMTREQRVEFVMTAMKVSREAAEAMVPAE